MKPGEFTFTTSTINLRLPDHIRALLEEESVRDGISVPLLARRAILRYYAALEEADDGETVTEAEKLARIRDVIRRVGGMARDAQALNAS